MPISTFSNNLRIKRYIKNLASTMNIVDVGWHQFPGSQEVSVELGCESDDVMTHPLSVHVCVCV